MNKNQATAYAVMAIYNLQNSANGDFKLKNIKLLDIEEEMKCMYKIYSLKEIVEISKRKIG